MAANEGELKPLDLENTRADQEQEDLKRAAQTDKVVRGVNGSLVPSARKLRPLAGIIIIVIVVLAALYMREGMATRNRRTAKQAETAKVGVGPATTVENGLLSDQARSGFDTGQTHIPGSLHHRSSITNADDAGKTRSSSVPPIEYKQGSVSADCEWLPFIRRANALGRVQAGKRGDGIGNLGERQPTQRGS